MSSNDAYELVVGLEVHAQLLTESKLFCGDSASFGAAPNTHISPITMAHPGTLPLLNRKAVEYAIKMGLACNCSITRKNYFARKNYFYPDLPKGYQISQHTTPICVGGFVRIKTPQGIKDIKLNRIHMEEDAGKSIHDLDPNFTCVDLNRAGVPLVEIVTEPDIHSAEEAYAYLTEVRKLLRYLEVCDGNMEEGSMRCDANISVRKKGDTRLGTKVEVKNLNSIRNVKRAIEWEANRLIELCEKGEPILQQTRSFDATNGTTFALRSKEEANDYRYFADPDLTPFTVSDQQLNTITASMPELPEEKSIRYQQQLGLPEYDAVILSEDKDLAAYFESLTSALSSDQQSQFETRCKQAANWLMGPVRSYLNENSLEPAQFLLPSSKLAELLLLVEEGRLNFSSASSKVFPALLQEPTANVLELAGKLNILQNSDDSSIEAWVDQVLAQMPDKVTEYKKGKKGLIGLFMGEVKKLSKGQADPRKTTELLTKKLQA